MPETPTQPVESGRIVVISGPSGAGKTSLVRRVFAECPLPLVHSVSATTRAPRPGERDGVDYYFLSPEEFARRRERGEFLESCEVFGRGDWYGTLLSEVTPTLATGKWVVLEVDVQGMLAVRERYPDALTIFVRPASLDELEQRLRARATESPESLARRLEAARREMSAAGEYRYQVINSQRELERAAQALCGILLQNATT